VQDISDRTAEQRRGEQPTAAGPALADRPQSGQQEQRQCAERQRSADDPRFREKLQRNAVRLLDAGRVAPVEQMDDAERPRSPPPKGRSLNAPAASFHHTQRFSESVDSSRLG
jgi:hypothetical protein